MRNLLAGVILMLLFLFLAMGLAGAFKQPEPAPISVPNYERMADCLAEWHYVNQVQVFNTTLPEYTKAIRLCDLFTRELTE